LVGAGGGRQAESAAREQLRRWYVAQIQPRVMGLQPKDIVRATEVSRAYLPPMPSVVKNDPWWLDPKDPHRGLYVQQGLFGPTVPNF
jgi:hypothetical protein